MIVIPRDQPIVVNMNSYFLDVQKLVEHFVGEIGSGAVHFKSNSAEAAIFFEESSAPVGVIVERGERNYGPDTIQRLLEMASSHNFNVSIYAIDSERIHYWASLPSATPLYQNLTAEFTDLAALVKKMRTERLTGYVDVTQGSDKAAGSGGAIFFNLGSILGSCGSRNGSDLSASPEKLQSLIQSSASAGGVFNVFQVQMTGTGTPAPKVPKAPTTVAAANNASTSGDSIQMLSDLLQITETAIRESKGKGDFATALRRKFIQLADRYDFLDPFAGEVTYADGELICHDDLEPAQIQKAIFQSIKELAQEMNLIKIMSSRLVKWSEKYGVPLTEVGID